MSAIQEAHAGGTGAKQRSPKLPFYHVLWVQVLLAMIAAVALGYWRPERAVAMKPLGDAFIRLITCRAPRLSLL
jgi:aerobic C4-dicarboxylate transport protein